MNEENPDMTEAKAKLQKAIEEFLNEIDPRGPMLLAASLAYEVTLWNNDNEQIYSNGHFMFGTGAMTTHIGLLETAKDELLIYLNRPERRED